MGDQGTLGGGAGGTPGGTLGQGAPWVPGTLGPRDQGTQMAPGTPQGPGPLGGPRGPKGPNPNPDLTLTKGSPRGDPGGLPGPGTQGQPPNLTLEGDQGTLGGTLGGGQGTLGGNPGGHPGLPHRQRYVSFVQF